MILHLDKIIKIQISLFESFLCSAASGMTHALQTLNIPRDKLIYSPNL